MPPVTVATILAVSFGVGFSGAVTPGPLLVYDIRETMRRGFVAGPLVVLGHALLELAVVAVMALGAASFLKSAIATSVIGLVGGLVLLWMGYEMARGSSRHAMPSAVHASGAGAPSFSVAPVLGGALVSAANPYWSLWWVTIGLAYLVWARGLGVVGLGAFYLGHVAADLVWFGGVSAATASGRRLLTPWAYRWLVVACGLFLVALGAAFIASGIGSLRAGGA